MSQVEIMGINEAAVKARLGDIDAGLAAYKYPPQPAPP